MSQEKLLALQQMYREIDRRIEAFVRSTKIACVSGCGDCCTRFEPYISILEALIIAECLNKNPCRLHAFWDAPRDKEKVLCPFFCPGRPLHCGIYSIRPLICRLFAFSAREISGTIRYEPCQMIARHYPSEVERADRLMQREVSIPIYKEVYQRLKDIAPVLATDLHPLMRSVELALERYKDLISGEYQGVQNEDSQELAIPFSRAVREHFARLQPKEWVH